MDLAILFFNYFSTMSQNYAKTQAANQFVGIILTLTLLNQSLQPTDVQTL